MRRKAFTLIEVLVVVAIIALLIGILLPSLRNARELSKRSVCMANLHNVFIATLSYTVTYQDRLPDRVTLGNYGFRRGYLERDPKDPNSLPEVFGLPALFIKTKMMQSGDVWVCPGTSDWMKAYKNTYAWSTAPSLAASTYTKLTSKRDQKQVRMTWWSWDNYTQYPYDSGWRAPNSIATRYSIPEARRFYPHFYYGAKQKWASGSTDNSRAMNVGFLDGHVTQARFEYLSGS